MNRSRACGRISTSMNNRPDAVILYVIPLEESITMPHEFRFLLICNGASNRLEDRQVNLHGIVNDIDGSSRERTELTAIIGLILMPEMEGKSLDLMCWMLDNKGERERIPEYAGTPMILPNGTGPVVLPCPIELPTPRSGIYGFELFDRDGIFGPPEELIATYMFGVNVAK